MSDYQYLVNGDSDKEMLKSVAIAVLQLECEHNRKIDAANNGAPGVQFDLYIDTMDIALNVLRIPLDNQSEIGYDNILAAETAGTLFNRDAFADPWLDLVSDKTKTPREAAEAFIVYMYEMMGATDEN